MLLDNRNVLPFLSTLYCRYDNDNNNKLWLIIKTHLYTILLHNNKCARTNNVSMYQY